MQKVMPFLCILALTACGQSDTPALSTLPSVDELAADPERLKGLRQQCKADWAKVGDALCNMAAEAARKRFMGDGVPYTPPAEPPKF